MKNKSTTKKRLTFGWILWKGIKLIGLGLGIIGLFLFEKLQILSRIAHRKWRRLTKDTRKAVALAVVIHLVILVVAALIIAVPGRRTSPEIVATIVDRPTIPDIQKQRLSAIKQIQQIQPSAASSISKMMLANTQASVSLPPTKIDIQSLSLNNSVGNLGMGNSFGNGTGNGMGGRSSFPMEIRGRCVPGERIRLLRRNGGSEDVEKAVTRSLDWLKKSQNFDGTWGKKYQGAMTGLALLCYLGHCETPNSGEYKRTVTKGIQALLEMGEDHDDGYFTEIKDSNFVYEHGIATYALGEALAMTKGNEIPGLRTGFTNGVKKIIAGQQQSGGWVYGYSETSSGDLSVAGWQVQALKAAKRLNLSISGLDSTIASASIFVSQRQGADGGFGYRQTGDKASLAGVGILSLQFLDASYRSRAPRAFDYWFKKTPQFSYNDGDCDLYAAYYINQATFNYGGNYWKKWNEQMRPTLLNAQSEDGSFPMEATDLDSQPAPSVTYTGRDSTLYRTTLCTLMLEVYYRYLPVNNSK